MIHRIRLHQEATNGETLVCDLRAQSNARVDRRYFTWMFDGDFPASASASCIARFGLQPSSSEVVRAFPRAQASIQDAWLPGALAQVRILAGLAHDWNGRGSDPPSFTAVTHAQAVLRSAWIEALPPERILASSDGGIAMYFFGTERLEDGARVRYASLDCCNSGEIVLTMGNRRTDSVQVVDVDLDDAAIEAALERVASFVGS